MLAADIAGYSRLMGLDEERTLAQLKAFRKTLVDPTIASHRGRIVKTTGDGMLVEFGSAVDAARCSVIIQEKMAVRNSSVSPELPRTYTLWGAVVVLISGASWCLLQALTTTRRARRLREGIARLGRIGIKFILSKMTTF